MAIRDIGDAQNVVVRLHLDRDGLAFLADELPQGDAFTKDLRKTLNRVDLEAEIAQARAAERNIRRKIDQLEAQLARI